MAGIGLGKGFAGGIKGHAPIKRAALLVATDIIQQIAEFVAFFLSELIILQRFLEQGFDLVIFHNYRYALPANGGSVGTEIILPSRSITAKN